MKNIRPKVLCLLTLSIFFCSCKKKENIYIYIPDDLKDYSVFYTGSGWKYLNEATGTYDTTWITGDPSFSFYSIGEDINKFTEECVITYHPPLMVRAKIDPYSYRLAIRSSYSCTAICSRSYSPGVIFGGLPAGMLTNIAQLDSLKVNNRVFNNVLVTQYQTIIYPQKDTSTFTFYFVKKVGIIQFKHSLNGADTSWSLINYKTVLKR